MNFEFATAPRIVFGPGSIKHVGTNVKGYGRRVLVVAGGNPARAEKLLASLAAAGISTTSFSVTGEPEIVTVENGVARAKSESCEFVISLGGGSAIDAGKAIAAMMTNDGAL